MASTTLGHNPNATGEERKQYIEDLSLAKHHPDPRVREAAQARLDAHGTGPNINDMPADKRVEFENLLRQENQRRGPQAPGPQLGIPGEINLTMDQLRVLASKVGHELVPMGDKPTGGAWVEKYESQIKALRGEVDLRVQECDTLR